MILYIYELGPTIHLYKCLSVSKVATEEEVGMGQGKAVLGDKEKRSPQSAQLAGWQNSLVT